MNAKITPIILGNAKITPIILGNDKIVNDYLIQLGGACLLELVKLNIIESKENNVCVLNFTSIETYKFEFHYWFKSFL